MQSPIPEARAAESARISASIDRFLSDGGKIESIPIGRSADYDPMHRGPLPDREQRKEAAYRARMESAKPSARIPCKPTKASLWREEWGDKVIAMFDAGTNIAEIECQTGQARHLITPCIVDSGRNPAANKYPQPPPELIEQIKAMAADRYSGRYTAVILGLDRERVYTIARKNGIHFVSRNRGQK